MAPLLHTSLVKPSNSQNCVLHYSTFMVLNPNEPKICSNLVSNNLIPSQFNQLTIFLSLSLSLTLSSLSLSPLPLKIVESLHTLVNSSVGGSGGSTAISMTGGSVGPVCLPRRAETFGGFDSHQMNSSKSKTYLHTHTHTHTHTLHLALRWIYSDTYLRHWHTQANRTAPLNKKHLKTDHQHLDVKNQTK